MSQKPKPSELDRAPFKRQPPSLKDNPSRALAELSQASKKLWEGWNKRAASAIAAGDAEALQTLREEGFFPSTGARPPGCHENWWMSAFMMGGIKGVSALATVFPQQAHEAPTVEQALAGAKGYGYSRARLEEALRGLPFQGSPWRAFVALDESMLRELMGNSGADIMEDALESGWLSAKELNAGKSPLAISLSVFFAGALTSRPPPKGDESSYRATCARLLVKVCETSLAAGGPSGSGGSVDLISRLNTALRWGYPVEALQPAFDLAKREWREPLSKMAAPYLTKAPGDAKSQANAALIGLSMSSLGELLRGAHPGNIGKAAGLGLLDVVTITVDVLVEHPLKARRHWVEATAKAGRPIDMSKRFDRIASVIEASSAPAKQKEDWLALLSESPSDFPSERVLTVPTVMGLSPVAMAIKITQSPEALQSVLTELSERGFNLREGVEQATLWLDSGTRLAGMRWLKPLLERQELLEASKEAKAAAGARSAMRV